MEPNDKTFYLKVLELVYRTLLGVLTSFLGHYKNKALYELFLENCPINIFIYRTLVFIRQIFK